MLPKQCDLLALPFSLSSPRPPPPLQSATARLDLELRLLLSSLPAPFSPSESDAEAADDIAAVARVMVAAGYGAECVKAFRSLRRAAFDDALARLLGPDAQVQKLDPGLLDLRARSWFAAAPAAVRRLFAGERALCDRVFAAPDAAAIRDPIFADVAGPAAARLLSFPGAAAARARRCPEKLFSILDLYGALSDLWPEIDSLFPSSSSSAAAAAAGDSLLRLAEAARSLIGDFEAAIQGEASRSPVPGGGVHPMTGYVMNYLVLLSDYNAALADIYADLPLQIPTPLPDSIFDSSSISSPSSSSNSEDSTLSARMAWLILVLLCKLDKKAECYREESVARHSVKARRYAESYERIGWGPVAAAIPAATATAAEAAEWMRLFNAAAEAALRAQESAVVADEAMRAAIRANVAGMVVPAYHAFYQRCREVMGPRRPWRRCSSPPRM
uniref:Exocyst subunit Exo70 family protein n=1 Tax=Ananas comosus var. bracteatus TaxID=296719 RepID=A0A6V7QXH9_ANACO